MSERQALRWKQSKREGQDTQGAWIEIEVEKFTADGADN